MNAYLQVGRICMRQALAYACQWLHFIGEQSAVLRIISVRREEISRARSQRPISVSLQRSQSKKFRSERVPDPDLRLVIPLRFEDGRVDPKCQLVLVRQLREAP